ncbi:MAG: M56 family metallopeptidase, partial [Verrucomicrobiota bacterium]
MAELVAAGLIQSFVIAALLAFVLLLLRGQSILLRNAFARTAVGFFLVAPLLSLLAFFARFSWWEWRPGSLVFDLSNPIPIMNILGLIWLIGMFFGLSRMVLGIHALDRLKACLPLAPEDRIPHDEDVLAATVYVSSEGLSPFCFGFKERSVVVPSSVTDHPDSLEMILAHEMAHLRQGDPMLGLVQRLTNAIHWWNPFVHFINRELSRIRESLCDYQAVEQVGDLVRYSQCLLDHTDKLSRPPGRLMSVPATSTYSSLKQRLQILARGSSAFQSIGLLSLMTIYGFALALGFFSLGIGADFSRVDPLNPERIMADRLILHVPFTNDFNDISGAGFIGLPHGNAHITNGAAVFDGEGDWVRFPHQPLNQRPFAISFWIKSDNAPERRGLIEQKGTT